MIDNTSLPREEERPVPVRQATKAIGDGQTNRRVTRETPRPRVWSHSAADCRHLFAWHRRSLAFEKPRFGCVDTHLLLYRYPTNSYSYVGELQMPCWVVSVQRRS